VTVGVNNAPVTSWAPTSITATLPGGATTGSLVYVTVNSVNSNSLPLVLDSVSYFFSDSLASTRVVTDSNGNICNDADFLSYGGERVYTNNCAQTYKFTGYERDAETGNDYAVARHYNSRIYRFLQPDPFGMGATDLTNPQSLNRYAYVGNNPSNVTDPSGTDWLDGGDFGGFGGGGFGCDWCEGGGSIPSFLPPISLPQAIGVPTLNLPGIGSGCDWGCLPGQGPDASNMGENFSVVDGKPVGDYNGDKYCTVVSLENACLSYLYWWGTSQNGGWMPTPPHTKQPEKPQSAQTQKCEDSAVVSTYNKNIDTDIEAAKKPVEGAAAGAATGCLWGTKWGFGEGCAAGAAGGAAEGAVAGLLKGAGNMIYDTVQTNKQLNRDLAACNK
jgi:RHS repeat-associated protein